MERIQFREEQLIKIVEGLVFDERLRNEITLRIRKSYRQEKQIKYLNNVIRSIRRKYKTKEK